MWYNGIVQDTLCVEKEGAPLIRIYDDVDSRFILEDMMCKLEILYGAPQA